ncbi:MAG: T9SS type A sorting domain-containing protein [Cytophagaceae bacterium]|jgi:uncharacterized repeat protein (TIGR01451 family)|nr:T9SS type A sorting domain-containing protein [Cytophagaceae bacterium]
MYLDDGDPNTDIYCARVRGSYDPNDKRGFPSGVTEQHFILPNETIEYIIRFQNTGTDTAFTVVIRDTLDQDLDIYSVRSGVSSHNYSFRMFGPRILEWTFEHIMLPDSNTNQPLSNGFVTFTVNQRPNLPDFTSITNSPAIYFDFNDPIITNETSHVINRNYFMRRTEVQLKNGIDEENSVTLFPNPTNGSFSINYKGKENADLFLYNASGKIVLQRKQILKGELNLTLEEPPGIYFLRINSISGSKVLKLVKQ